MRNKIIAIRDQANIKLAVGLAVLLNLTKVEEELPLVIAAIFANTGIEVGINPTTAHLVALMEPEVEEITENSQESQESSVVTNKPLTPSDTINEPEFLKKTRTKSKTV
jgi:hypothetical protein